MCTPASPLIEGEEWAALRVRERTGGNTELSYPRAPGEQIATSVLSVKKPRSKRSSVQGHITGEAKI